MRIAFYFENYWIGGGSRYVLDCIDGALKQGHEVVLFSNRGAISESELAQLDQPLQLQAVRVYERTQSVDRWLGKGRLAVLIRKFLVLASPVLLLLNVFEVWRRMGQWRPHVLVSCNGGYPAAESALAAVLAARLRGVPTALVILSQPQMRRKALAVYDWLLDLLIGAWTNVFVLNSEQQGRIFETHRKAPAEKICTVYNGISNQSSVSSRSPKSGQEVVIGVACRLDSMKGLDDLIQAIALIDQRISIKLRILGEGEYRETLESLVRRLEVSSRVDFVGFKFGQELQAEYDAFDMYVFPSHWEGLPYALLEAMRAGLPIVTTSVGGIPEAVRHDREAILVQPRAPAQLKDAIENLAADPLLAKRLGAAARQRFVEMFTLEKMQRDFVSVVTGVTKSRLTV